MNPQYRNSRSLPTDRIWCSRCPGKNGAWKPVHSFANNRKNDADYLLRKGARMGDDKITSILVCNQCSGAPRVEIRCNGLCNKVRALECFSNNQRRDPDTAICRKCVAEHENVRPGHIMPEKDNSDDEFMEGLERDNTSSNTSTMGGGVSLAPAHGYEVLHSTQSGTRTSVTGQQTMSRIDSATASTAGYSDASSRSAYQAPPVEVGAGGFAKIKKGHRDVYVPRYEDDDVELASDEEEFEPWVM